MYCPQSVAFCVVCMFYQLFAVFYKLSSCITFGHLKIFYSWLLNMFVICTYTYQVGNELQKISTGVHIKIEYFKSLHLLLIICFCFFCQQVKSFCLTETYRGCTANIFQKLKCCFFSHLNIYMNKIQSHYAHTVVIKPVNIIKYYALNILWCLVNKVIKTINEQELTYVPKMQL